MENNKKISKKNGLSYFYFRQMPFGSKFQPRLPDLTSKKSDYSAYIISDSIPPKEPTKPIDIPFEAEDFHWTQITKDKVGEDQLKYESINKDVERCKEKGIPIPEVVHNMPRFTDMRRKKNRTKSTV